MRASIVEKVKFREMKNEYRKLERNVYRETCRKIPSRNVRGIEMNGKSKKKVDGREGFLSKKSSAGQEAICRPYIVWVHGARKWTPLWRLYYIGLGCNIRVHPRSVEWGRKGVECNRGSAKRSWACGLPSPFEWITAIFP
jgi:hypothetical protein